MERDDNVRKAFAYLTLALAQNEFGDQEETEIRLVLNTLERYKV